MPRDAIRAIVQGDLSPRGSKTNVFSQSRQQVDDRGGRDQRLTALQVALRHLCLPFSNGNFYCASGLIFSSSHFPTGNNWKTVCTKNNRMSIERGGDGEGGGGGAAKKKDTERERDRGVEAGEV